MPIHKQWGYQVDGKGAIYKTKAEAKKAHPNYRTLKRTQGYEWGQHGAIYKTIAGAQEQAAAAHAHGYSEGD